MTAADLQQALTDRKLPCPECGGPLVGVAAGVACGHCGATYGVRDVEGVA